MAETSAPAPLVPVAAPTMPAADDSQKTLAAVAYILLWLTGLIIFLVAKKDQKYARWNAVQAIGVGVVWVVLLIVLNILGTMAALGGGGMAGFGLIGLLWGVLGLGMLVLIIILAIKAYQGTPIRLPVIADMADKYA